MRQNSIFFIEYLSSIIECRDLSSEVHCQHVRKFTELFFDKIIEFFPDVPLKIQDKEPLLFAASLHDVGKIAVPDRILMKPGRLSFDEFQIQKNHTTKGMKIFQKILDEIDEDNHDYKYFLFAKDVAYYHHERYDGNGYPVGLKGDEIPITAQIVGLADVYDVLSSDRIYKSAKSKEEAFEMIVDGECGVFSPKLIEIFQMIRMELEEVIDSDPQVFD